MHSENDQYRRPRPHFTAEETEIRPTIDRHQLLTGSAMLLGIALLMVLAMIPRSAEAPGPEDAAQVHLDAAQRLAAECQVIQHLSYTPCGHSVTRRQALPTELSGQTREALAAAYDGWQITAFAPAEVTMSRAFSLYCPQHAVLMPDDNGMLCIWENRYGDALALVKELNLPVGELPESLQEEARAGKGFDTREDLEKWLENAAS